MALLLCEDGEEKNFLPLDVKAAVADMLLLERLGSGRLLLLLVDNLLLLSRLVEEDTEVDFLMGGVSLLLVDDMLSCDGLLQLRALSGDPFSWLDGLTTSFGRPSCPSSSLSFSAGVLFVVFGRDSDGAPSCVFS